tara:strand:- start:10571 stop:10708 length:138 start_codon:yes stop_codon:yes gene_type:complete
MAKQDKKHIEKVKKAQAYFTMYSISWLKLDKLLKENLDKIHKKGV